MADFLQLPPVKGKLLFSQFSNKDSNKHLLGLQLWDLYAELSEVVRENDKVFIKLLSKFRFGSIDDNVEKLIKARFIHESGENHPKDALHMYKENKAAMKQNEAVLNDLTGELYRIKANDKIPDSCKYPLATTQAGQNQQ